MNLFYLDLCLLVIASKVGIPPTAVGGWFISDLQNRYQIASLIPPTAVGGYFNYSLAAAKMLELGGL